MALCRRRRRTVPPKLFKLHITIQYIVVTTRVHYMLHYTTTIVASKSNTLSSMSETRNPSVKEKRTRPISVPFHSHSTPSTSFSTKIAYHHKAFHSLLHNVPLR